MSASHPLQLDGESTSEAIENEIRELEVKLAQAKLRLEAGSSTSNTNKSIATTINGKTSNPHQDAEAHETSHGRGPPEPLSTTNPYLNPTTHFLLLLADSALPLGSFAFSSGLESYLAHAKLTFFDNDNNNNNQNKNTSKPSFDIFLPLSISSYASTTLPFLLAAHRDPSQLPDLDDALDAAVMCTVGKRASVAQGRALLGIWDRSFCLSTLPPSPNDKIALRALAEYTKLLRTSSSRTSTPFDLPPVSAHLAPLFGVIASLLSLSLHQTAYVFVLGHVKALVSAAVRANLMGPYAAQKVLASGATQDMIAAAVEREWETPYEGAGQSVPMMDMWVGRHEMLYSRIFNS